jgi:hypothetical protein
MQLRALGLLTRTEIELDFFELPSLPIGYITKSAFVLGLVPANQQLLVYIVQCLISFLKSCVCLLSPYDEEDEKKGDRS